MIIALAGRKGSGKSTAAEALINKGFERISFAEPLKALTSHTFNIPLGILNDPVAKESMQITVDMNDETIKSLLDGMQKYYPLSELERFRALRKTPRTILTTPRQLLQFIGTELFRNTVSQDIWLRIFEARISPEKNYVCDDCRFPNEAELINKLNGKVVLINRPGLVSADTHASESMDLPYDYKITNYDLNYFIYDINTTIDLIIGFESGTQL